MKTHGESPRGKVRAGGHGEDDPTNVFDSGNFRRETATPTSGPIQVISKKTPGVSSGAISLPEAAPRQQVKLRAISEVTSAKVPQQDQLGYLAPPRDRNEVRARRRRDFIVWGSVCVILASAIALAVWFAAKR